MRTKQSRPMSEELNVFYTYAYLREDNTPYYIGKGKGNRVIRRQKNDVKPPKDRSRIIFLKKNLTEEEAYKHEIYMIFVFGRKDLGTGILLNKTVGGDGAAFRGKDNPRAKKWRITFENGKIEVIYSLQTWAIKNGYNPTSVRNVYTGGTRKYKDIIKVEQYDKNGNIIFVDLEEKIKLKNQKSVEYYQKNIEKSREYQNKWQRKNRHRYYKKNKEKILENQKKRRKENIEKYREYRRKYREKNREKINEYQRERYHRRKNQN